MTNKYLQDLKDSPMSLNSLAAMTPGDAMEWIEKNQHNYALNEIPAVGSFGYPALLAELTPEPDGRMILVRFKGNPLTPDSCKWETGRAIEYFEGNGKYKTHAESCGAVSWQYLPETKNQGDQS
ncbi:MAG: hypothetical protein ACJAYB_000099 [Psychromonas sp.]|jgi:hypothetical protein